MDRERLVIDETLTAKLLLLLPDKPNGYYVGQEVKKLTDPPKIYMIDYKDKKYVLHNNKFFEIFK